LYIVEEKNPYVPSHSFPEEAMTEDDERKKAKSVEMVIVFIIL